jgi:hypothetical protein
VVVVLVSIIESAHWCFHSNLVSRSSKVDIGRQGLRVTLVFEEPQSFFIEWCGSGFDKGPVLVRCFGAPV